MWVAGPALWHTGMRAACTALQQTACADTAACCTLPSAGAPHSGTLNPLGPPPQALANSLWSFANLRWYPVRLLEVITRAVGRKLHSMSPQEISNSIWAYAK